MSNSSRGRGWKVLNSAWILLSFVGGAWIGFLLIGIKAKEPKWKKTAIIYAVALWAPIIGIGVLPVESSLSTVCAFVWMLIIIVSIVHSFIANKKYLICRDILLSSKVEQSEQRKLKEEIRKNYEKEGVIPPEAKIERTYIVPKAPSLKDPVIVGDIEEDRDVEKDKENKNDGGKLNINVCTEDALSKLPGISVVAAKKAIEYRNIQKGFLSIDEFYAIADIKPHFIIQLNDLISCDSGSTCVVTDNKDESDEQKGRILDL